MAVSIHTPAWGTTHLEQELARIQKQFQSTRLREARRSIADHDWLRARRFNPRACVRRDLAALRIGIEGETVSIHAPA